MVKRNNKKPFPYQILIVDIIIFILLILLVVFFDSCYFSRAFSHFNEAQMSGICIPLFLVILIGFIFYLYIEKKYNRLKFKNVFLLLGGVIALINIIAVMALPNVIDLPNSTRMVVTPLMRLYYIASGFVVAILPYLFFYLIPRKVLHRHYMNVILYLLAGGILLSILLSFATDFNTYAHLFQTHFADINNYSIGSVFQNKNVYARILLGGIFISMSLHVRKKNAKWLLLLIPYLLALILTMSKMTIVLGFASIAIYLLVRLILMVKGNKDNLVIALLIIAFIALIGSLLTIQIVRAESGFFFQIKEIIRQLAEGAKTTFESRQLIWQSAFNILLPYQYIFGFGVNSFGMALHLVYGAVAPSWENMEFIYVAHNAGVELIGRGGIILLGIYVFIYLYLIRIAIKMRKHNPLFTFITILFTAIYFLAGLTDSVYLCGNNEDLVLSMIIIVPLMSEYYLLEDKEESELRKDLIQEARAIKKEKYSSRLLNLNKKRILLEAQYIAYDLNKHIKL